MGSETIIMELTSSSGGTWNTLTGAPFVTVSTDGIANGGSATSNNGADYGPDTAGTSTGGIQEALNASTSAIIYVMKSAKGKYIQPNTCIFYTANYQVLIFEAGCYIQPLSTWAKSGTGNFGGNPPPVINVGVGSAGQVYHHCALFGNGTIIDGVNTLSSSANAYSMIGVAPSGQAVAAGNPYMIKIDGFELIHTNSTPFVVSGGNGSGYNNTYTTATKQIEISNIYAHEYQVPTTAVNLNGLQCNGSVWYCWAHDCIFDCSANTSSEDYSNMFIYGNQGDVKYWLVERCIFKGNGTVGQVIELQGANNAPATLVVNEYLTFRECTFDTGASSGAPLAGAGGGYIDDYDTSASTNDFIDKIIFENCKWVNCGLTYKAAASRFGYVRYYGGAPGAISGTLTGRSPNEAPLAITVGASPFTFTNTNTFRVIVYVAGGTVSSITYNGTAVSASTGASFELDYNDALVVTYSAAPSMYQKAIP